MRVLHLNEHLNWTGGVETYLLHLIPALESAGIEQHYAFARGNSSLLSRSYHLPDLGKPEKKAEQFGFARVKELLNTVQPDLIHVHRIYNLGVLRACLEFGPTVVTCHDYLYLCPAGSFFHRRTKTICNRKASPACFVITIFKRCLTPRPRFAIAYYRRVKTFCRWRREFHAVICPSESVRLRLLAMDFDPLRTVTLPYFCPLEPRLEPRPLPKEPTILFMGRVRPIKGYDVFIRALGELPNVRGIMVGDVDNTSAKAIDRLATDSGCASRLEVRPWASRHEIPSLLQSTTLFVFPSICPETLGIVGLEAMAFGLPVVASDVGGVRQWLRHGENGLLVPPKDHHALAAAIESLINAPETLMRMGKAGLDTVRNGFLVQQHVERLTSLYYQVACGNPLPVSAHGSTS